jgi:hypothetical protein
MEGEKARGHTSRITSSGRFSAVISVDRKNGKKEGIVAKERQKDCFILIVGRAARV